MNDTPRYATLRDYLRVIREQRLVIAVMIIVAVGIALAFSLTQKKEYQATATISFQDPAQQLNVLGGLAPGNAAPEQTPQARAQTLNEPAVVKRVQRALAEEAAQEDRASKDGKTASTRGAPSGEDGSGAETSGNEQDVSKYEIPLPRIQDAITTEVNPTSFLVDVTATWGDDAFAAHLANEFAEQAADEANDEARRRYNEALDGVQERLGDLGTSITDQTERAALADQVTRLQFLTSSANAGRVVKGAQTPDAPVSPRPVRNGLIGLVLGIVIGLIVAFLRDTLDRRLRGPREIQDELSFPLVGHVRDETMGTVARPAADGSEHGPDLEAFRILRQNLEFLSVDSPLRTTLVTSALPEEGKSTVAASLAFASAVSGKSTLLVECDLRRPCLADRLGLPSQPGLADYLADRAAPSEILQVVPFATSLSANGAEPDAELPAVAGGSRPIVCITAGTPSPQPAELLGSERFRQFLSKVAKAYEVVIMDTAPLLPVADTLELLTMVDGVIFCVRSGQTTREQVAAARQALGHFPDQPTGLVVTGLRRRDQADYGYYSYGYAPASTAARGKVGA